VVARIARPRCPSFEMTPPLFQQYATWLAETPHVTSGISDPTLKLSSGSGSAIADAALL
jgi:hypothetical protein